MSIKVIDKQKASAWIVYGLLTIFCFSLFTYHTTAVKNISAILLLLSLSFNLYRSGVADYWRSFRECFRYETALCFVFIAWLCIALISSFMAWHGFVGGSLHVICKFLRYSAVLLLIGVWLLQIRNFSPKFFVYLFSGLLWVYLLGLIFMASSHKVHVMLSPFAHLERADLMAFASGYGFFVNLLYPFMLLACCWSKCRCERIFWILSVIGVLCFVVFTASRGCVLTAVCEVVLFLYCLREWLRSTFGFRWHYLLTLFVVLLIIIASVFYHFDSHVHRKILQRNTSGRTELIKTRFPIFIQHGGGWFGSGYSGKIYQDLLVSNHAPEVVGAWVHKNGKKYYEYFHDDPTLLILFYEGGVVGLSVFLLLLFVWAKPLLKPFIDFDVKSTRLSEQFRVTIFISVLGYLGVRGLTEHVDLSYVFFMMVLELLTQSCDRFSM